MIWLGGNQKNIVTNVISLSGLFYSRTGLRTAPSVAHLDSPGIAPLGLFSAQYENKLETLKDQDLRRTFVIYSYIRFLPLPTRVAGKITPFPSFGGVAGVA